MQGSLQAAIGKVADHAVEIVAAGRTDAGVHGYGQVVHFDTPARRSAYGWLLGINTHLPDDISLRWITPVPAHFHARYSATARRYRYLIHNSRARSALRGPIAAHVMRPLDAQAMHRAAQVLVGEHDFSAFRGSQCQSPSPVREIKDISVWRRHEFVVIDVRANAFLHHMVRNIAGSLIEVGQGRQAEPWIARLLQGRDRTQAGMNALACGLYFLQAEYPAEFALPESAEFWLP